MGKTSYNAKKIHVVLGWFRFLDLKPRITSWRGKKKKRQGRQALFHINIYSQWRGKNQSPCVWGRVSELPVILPATDTKESVSIKAKAASLVSALA